MKILIAEDDLTSRTVLAGVLKKNGDEVVATVNGAEAWELLQQPAPPALMILDWMMPKMDGLEVVHKVRALQTDRPPYIIMLTTKGDKADIVTALEAGANDYLSKPFDVDELLARVNVGKRMIEMHDEMNNSKEKYRLLIENSYDIIYTITADGVFTFVSPAWTMLLGHQTTQVVGHHFKDFVHPDDLPKCMEFMQKVIETGQRQESVEYRVRHINGSWRWYISDGAPVRDETNTVVYCQGIVRDITKRKKAEDALMESKALIEAVVENVPLMIFLKEATDLRFIIFNRAGEELLGYDRKALIGKNNLDLFPPEQAAHFMAKDREVLDGELGILDIPEESVLTAKKGQRLLHTRKVCIRGSDGITKYLLGISEDITEHKQMEAKREELERQLHQSQKLEAIGQLAGGIAHDFNNQLASIMGYADMLYKNLDDPNLKSKAEKIIHASERSADLIKNLMAFSRKGKYLTVPINVNTIIKEVVSLLEHSIDKKIKIKQVLNAGSTTISGDPSQFQNALLNLALNARDALSAGGGIVFTTDNVDIGDVPIGMEQGQNAAKVPYLKICVIDDGTGMDDEVKKHLYEPFFTTKPQGEGTGMGLSSVYGAVQNHNGVISVKSKLGEGTEFSLFFPLINAEEESKNKKIDKAGPAPGKSEPEPTATPGKKAKILLADDDEMLRDMVSEILGFCNYEVVTCNDGQEAVEIYRKEWKNIDLVILDMMMPEMNGKEAFLEMQAINKDIKALLISGFSIEGEAQELLNAGMKGFIQKPFDVDILMKAVEENCPLSL